MSKAFEARLESLERQVGEIYQNQAVISLAITRLTKLVEDAAENVLPEAPESSD